jgi:hypothetical protein
MGYQNVPSGPNAALVLMMFNVPAYEEWFERVVQPVVLKYGRCVRITKNLEEWRTEMRRVALQADMVLVDLSHPPDTGLSPNVIWELSEIQGACFNKELSRNRLLFRARPRACKGAGAITRFRPFFRYQCHLGAGQAKR